MKKLIIVIPLTVYILVSVSCEKQYTCACKEVDTVTGTITKTWNPMKGTYTKSDAEKWCSSNETSGFGIRIECDLR